MFVRLTYFNIAAERADELKKAYYEEVAPVIRQQEGNADVMLLVPGNAGDEYISCTIWKSEEFEKKFEASDVYVKVFGKIRAITAGVPHQKYYTLTPNSNP